MDQDDLFLEPASRSTGSWTEARRALDDDLVERLRRSTVAGVEDLAAAQALASLLNQDFTAYGTGGGEALNNAEAALALRALKRVLERLGITIEVPWRDFDSFRTYWNANEGYGSWQARRDMVSKVFSPVFEALDRADEQVLASVAPDALDALPNSGAIHENLRRLNRNVDSDPRLAVSVAKDLVESTAKLVLRQRGVAFTGKEDLPALVARAQESLALTAAKVPESNPEATALKTILGSLTRITQGVTELRNRVGVGHGPESVPTWVRPRHARLAAGAATTWCNLMLETLGDPEAPWRTEADQAAPG